MDTGDDLQLRHMERIGWCFLAIFRSQQRGEATAAMSARRKKVPGLFSLSARLNSFERPAYTPHRPEILLRPFIDRRTVSVFESMRSASRMGISQPEIDERNSARY